MSTTVEDLFKAAGIQYEDVVMAEVGAKAIWEEKELGLDINEYGDLLINSDDLEVCFLFYSPIIWQQQVKTEIVIGEEDEEGEVMGVEDDGGEQEVVEEMVEEKDDGGEEHEEEEEGGGEILAANMRKCSVCGEVKHKKSLMRHMRLIHENQKFKCSVCGLFLNSFEKWIKHDQKHDIVESVVECPYCFQSFKGSKLWYHVTTIHKEYSENNFPCTLCTKTYKTKPNLSRHVRDKHKD